MLNGLPKYLLPVVCAGGVLLAGGSLADPAQEEFRDPPREDQREARDAVAAPRMTADDGAGPGVGSLVRSAPQLPAAALPDFTIYRDVPTKKQRFFSFLLPVVEAENARLAAIRLRLTYIYDHVRWHRKLAPADVVWLGQVAAEYGLDAANAEQVDFWVVLLERVDAVPSELALVQAANESAWGTSRFAREGNNLFGQWCFRQGCGMVPAGRPAGATYEVARFASVRESVGSYMHNLNTGRTYQTMREIRARMRAAGEAPRGTDMAAGLQTYSQRGMAYVNELRAMIRHNSDIIAELHDGATDDGKI